MDSDSLALNPQSSIHSRAVWNWCKSSDCSVRHMSVSRNHESSYFQVVACKESHLWAKKLGPLLEVRRGRVTAEGVGG